MKYYSSLLLLLLCGFLQSCQEEAPINLSRVEFLWDQTLCFDPWHTNAKETDAEILKAVEDYLSKERILGARAISVTSLEVPIAVCYACHCKNGRQINVTVPVTQKSKMLALGFMEKK